MEPDPPAAHGADRLEDLPTEARPEPGSVSSAHATERFAPGAMLAGRFRVVAPLGRGGMGEVYRAEDLRLGEPVALKFLQREVAADPGRLQRLFAEVRVGRKVSHPNVCRIHDIVEAQGQVFLSMEYVDGEDLSSLLTRIGRLPSDKALVLARHLCSGLAAIHDQGVVHRDLKPANVLVDGRGNARITDFGVAAPAAELLQRRAIAGTRAYMAPEQLSHGEASIRSDLYSLGLVLYEMFTGRRAFAAESVEELLVLQKETRPPSLTSSVGEIDPAIDRAILRCLSFDPGDRPSSAREILANFPGGDALDVAVAAGETPSPEVVAAANVVGDLSPAVAIVLLIAALGGLVATAGPAGSSKLIRTLGFPSPPEVLVARAEETLAAAGLRDPPVDRAIMFSLFEETKIADYYGSDSPGARPPVCRLLYRRSPREIRPVKGQYNNPVIPGYSDLGLVTVDDPPLRTPGEAEVFLAPDGSLVELRIVPPEMAATAAAERSEPAWSPLLAMTGVDPASLRPVPPRWSPPVGSDARAAWEASYPGVGNSPVRIEAGSFDGQPVWLRVLGPWMEKRPSSPERSPGFAGAAFVIVTMNFLAIMTAAFLARRNLQTGRCDRKGAFRIGMSTFVIVVVAGLFRVEHLADPFGEFLLLLTLLGQAAFDGLVGWGTYLALEPYVRRRWPKTLISWTRILAGRFRDPMVGRDVLVGLVAGAAAWWVPALLRLTDSMSTSGMTFLASPRHVVYFALFAAFPSMLVGLSMLFFLMLWRALFRRTEIGFVIIWLLCSAPFFILGMPFVSVIVAVLIVLMMRFGLLATAVTNYTWMLTAFLPFTLDPAVWYFGRSLAVLIFLAAAALCAFWISLGERSLLAPDLLEA